MKVKSGVVSAVKWTVDAGTRIVDYVKERTQAWNARLEEHKKEIAGRIEQEKYKGKVIERPQHRPEKAEIAQAQNCANLLRQCFPNGIAESMRHKTLEEREDAIMEFAQKGAKVFNVPISNVRVENIHAAVFGYYERNTNSLRINKLFLKEELGAEEQIYTVIHELTHAQQWHAVSTENAHGYSNSLLNEWSYNFEHYIPIAEGDEFYRKQPVEEAAFWMEQESKKLYNK